MNIILLLGIVVLQATATHKLKIVKPDLLANQFPNGHIPLHSSSIGYTPRDSTITGLLNLGNPPDGCTSLTPRPHPTIKNTTIPVEPFLHEFVLLSSSACANSIKANNVYQMGGYAAIIVRDQNTQIEKHGSKVNIPVMEIDAGDAAKITQFQAEYPNAYILASIEFQKNKKGNRTEVEVWLSSTDVEGYKLLNNISSFYLQQQDRIVLKPQYFVNEKNTLEKDGVMHVGCLSSGRYCAPELQYQTRL